MFSAYLHNEEITKFRVLKPHPRKALPPSMAAVGLIQLSWRRQQSERISIRNVLNGGEDEVYEVKSVVDLGGVRRAFSGCLFAFCMSCKQKPQQPSL